MKVINYDINNKNILLIKLMLYQIYRLQNLHIFFIQSFYLVNIEGQDLFCIFHNSNLTAYKDQKNQKNW